jgi:DNA-binding beta-propeller fold protein YncE
VGLSVAKSQEAGVRVALLTRMFDILPARDEFMKRWILLLSMETLLIPVKEKSQDLPYEVVVVEQGAGRVALLEPHSGAQRGAVSVGNSPHELAITSDGRFAYVSNFGVSDRDRAIGVPGDSVSIVDLTALTETKRLNTAPFKAPHGVKLRPPAENELYVNVEQGGEMMLVFSATTGQLLRKFSVPPETHNFVFSPDGRVLFLMAASNGVARVDPDTGTIVQRFKDDGPIRGLSWTSNGKQLLASGKNKLLFFDPITLGVERSIANLNVGQIIYSAVTPDGKHILAPCPIDQKVLLVESSTGKVVSTLIAGKDPIAVLIAPDGRTAYVSNGADDHASAIDLGTFEIRPFGKVFMPNGIGFRTTENRQGQK